MDLPSLNCSSWSKANLDEQSWIARHLCGYGDKSTAVLDQWIKRRARVRKLLYFFLLLLKTDITSHTLWLFMIYANGASWYLGVEILHATMLNEYALCYQLWPLPKKLMKNLTRCSLAMVRFFLCLCWSACLIDLPLRVAIKNAKGNTTSENQKIFTSSCGLRYTERKKRRTSIMLRFLLEFSFNAFEWVRTKIQWTLDSKSFSYKWNASIPVIEFPIEIKPNEIRLICPWKRKWRKSSVNWPFIFRWRCINKLLTLTMRIFRLLARLLLNPKIKTMLVWKILIFHSSNKHKSDAQALAVQFRCESKIAFRLSDLISHMPVTFIELKEPIPCAG